MARIVVLVACILVSLGACAPNARIADDSRTDACGKELLAGLEGLGAALRLPYKVPDNSGTILFETGHVELIYVLNGIKHACRFGLEGGPSDCRLAMYEKSVYRDGATDTAHEDFGSVPLKECRCVR